MINRKQIREYIACPQLGYNYYGKWGALNWEQRETINNLLDILDSVDSVIMKLQTENHQLQSTLEEIREFVAITIDIIKKQPTGNDEWILARLQGILDKGVSKNE